MGKKSYIEIQWQGRAGQGVVSASMILAEIMAREGKYVQAYPEFIAQIRRPLIYSYNRVSEHPIKINSTIREADIIILMNSSLLTLTDVKQYAAKDAVYIVNTVHKPQFIHEKLNLKENEVITIDAAGIAAEEGECQFANIPLLTVLMNHLKFMSMDRYKNHLAKVLSERLSPDLIQVNSKIMDHVMEEVTLS